MDHVLVIALFALLSLIELVGIWHWYDRAMHWRRRCQEAQAWSDYFQDEAEDRGRQQAALEIQHARLASRYTDLVRTRLARNFPIVEEAARRKN